jgi:hypothetical protein
VKAALVGSAKPYGTGTVGPDPVASGRGLLDVAGAITSASGMSTQGAGILPGVTSGTPLGASAPVVNRGLRPANPFARAIKRVIWGQPLVWKDPTLGGIAWSQLTWDSVAWDSIAWDNFDWDSIAWDSIAWDSVAWDSIAWDSIAWDSIAWDSIAWDAFNFD